MSKSRLGYIVSALVISALPALGRTTQYSYPEPCGLVWSAVKDSLAEADRYVVHALDDAKLSAVYQPNHDIHVNVSGVVLQHEYHMRLAAKGTGCEMQVVSNYSGWGRDDENDIKKHVDASLRKFKGGAPGATPKITEQETPSKQEAEGQQKATAK